MNVTKQYPTVGINNIICQLCSLVMGQQHELNMFVLKAADVGVEWSVHRSSLFLKGTAIQSRVFQSAFDNINPLPYVKYPGSANSLFQCSSSKELQRLQRLQNKSFQTDFQSNKVWPCLPSAPPTALASCRNGLNSILSFLCCKCFAKNVPSYLTELITPYQYQRWTQIASDCLQDQKVTF